MGNIPMITMLIGPPNPFRPSVHYDEALDTLTILEKDCKYTTTHDARSNIQLLLDPQDPTWVVGVKINCYKAAFAIKETYSKPPDTP